MGDMSVSKSSSPSSSGQVRSTGNTNKAQTKESAPVKQETTPQVKDGATISSDAKKPEDAGAESLKGLEGGLNALARESKEAKVDNLLTAQDNARTNKSLRPRGGKTYCNLAVNQTLKELGIDTASQKVGIVDPATGHPYTANTIAKNLASSEKEEGFWKELDAKSAQKFANDGVPVVAAQSHKGHGHVATVRPEGKDKGLPESDEVLINNVGKKNMVNYTNWTFDDKPIHYYAPRGDISSSN